MFSRRNLTVGDKTNKAWIENVFFLLAFLLLIIVPIFIEIMLLDLSECGILYDFSKIRLPILISLIGIAITAVLAVVKYKEYSLYKGIQRKLVLGRLFYFMDKYYFTASFSLIITMIISAIIETPLTAGFAFLLILGLQFSVLYQHSNARSDNYIEEKLDKLIKDIAHSPPQEAIKKIMSNADLYLDLLKNDEVSFRYTDMLRKYPPSHEETFGVFMFLGMLYHECMNGQVADNFYDFAQFCHKTLKEHNRYSLNFSELPNIQYVIKPWLVKLQKISELQLFEIVEIEKGLWEDFLSILNHGSEYTPNQKITIAILIDDSGEIIDGN